MSNELSASLETLFGKLESFVTTKTVVSEPITVGDVILVPLVEVSFGVGAGAFADAKENKKDAKDAGGGGLGARITPSAVIVISDGMARVMNVNSGYAIDKLIDFAPDVISKLTSVFGGKDKKAKTETKETLKNGEDE
ncbi:MAG: sporulation protein [Clostridiales bacterium]|jgi:uncharacterized spore protein YtfJ|nr:sporulation protein [Clostridiales bacterium]